MLRFEIERQTEQGQKIGVCGSCPSLGNWDVRHCLVLEPTIHNKWTGEVCVPQLVEYRYVLLVTQNPFERFVLKACEWDGQPRIAEVPEGGSLLVSDRGSEVLSSDHSVAAQRQPPGHVVGSRRCDTLPTPRVIAGLDNVSNAAKLLESLDVKPAVRLARIRTLLSGRSLDHEYDVQKSVILGQGMSGAVVLARRRADGLGVAVKTIPTQCLTPKQHKLTVAEVQNQLSMDHPNICRLLEVFEEPDRLHLVMEQMRGRNLYEHIRRKGKYSELDAAGYVQQMCSAVAYCHRNGVCHRDLKLENFCLEDVSEGARLKLVDFGLSEAFTSLPMTHACGTILYVAPEVFRGRYNAKCDMWSLGVITFIMLQGSAPFRGRDDRETVMLINRGKYKFHAPFPSNNACCFVRALLHTDPESRASADVALCLPWLVDAQRGEGERGQKLDQRVLRGMRIFLHCNELKRELLSAVAPLAMAKEVSYWADAFAALDRAGRGVIKEEDLAELLVQHDVGEGEAEALAAALQDADVESEGITYSTFLAACLSAYMGRLIGEPQVWQLFERLDVNGDGKVTLEEVGMALGQEIIESEGVRAEIGDGLTFDDFMKFLLGGPPTVSTDVSKLLQVKDGWRVCSVNARAGAESGEALNNARLENALWRQWARGVSLESANTTDGSVSPTSLSSQHSCALLASLGDDVHAYWRSATAKAKTGEVEAVRRENMAWRKQKHEALALSQDSQESL